MIKDTTLSFVLPGSMTPVENEHESTQETSIVENTSGTDDESEEHPEENDNIETESDNNPISSESSETDSKSDIDESETI